MLLLVIEDICHPDLGLEIPCSIIFRGKEKLISKIHNLKNKFSFKLKETAK